jgi:hypothetical protein
MGLCREFFLVLEMKGARRSALVDKRDCPGVFFLPVGCCRSRLWEHQWFGTRVCITLARSIQAKRYHTRTTDIPPACVLAAKLCLFGHICHTASKTQTSRLLRPGPSRHFGERWNARVSRCFTNQVSMFWLHSTRNLIGQILRALKAHCSALHGETRIRRYGKCWTLLQRRMTTSNPY